MSYLIKKVKVLDPRSIHHEKVVDVLIRKGIIERIGRNIQHSSAKTFEHKGACLSPGWVDVGTQICEPGYEILEDLNSLSRVAMAGGYTTILPFPNTSPVIDNKSQISFLKGRSNHLPIHLHPIGCISMGANGSDLAELEDMHAHGAIAFSDGRYPVKNTGLLTRALRYAKKIDGVLIDQAYDHDLALEGIVHEGIASTMMGLKGVPDMAEEIQIHRNLQLLNYAESKMMLLGLSSTKGISVIKSEKKKNPNLYCGVSVFNLCLSEDDVLNFDSNLKFQPPLRSTQDAKALNKGVNDGIIDIIYSNHEPRQDEDKEQAFAASANGSISLQTTFSLLRTLAPEIELASIIMALSLRAREIFNLPQAIIRKGESVDLTIFDPDATWVFDTSNNQSKSKNSAFLGRELNGKVLATFCGKNAYFAD